MADYLSQFTGSEIDSRLAKVPQLESGKQDTLVSGTNIKTVNGNSILGSGNLQIQTGETDVVKYTAQTLTAEQKAQARANIDAASLEDINSMDFVTAASLPTASASTMGHIYLIGPDASNNYDRYFTQQDGSSYSWVSLGSTQIDLSTYATQAEVDQLDLKVDDVLIAMGQVVCSLFKKTAYLSNDAESDITALEQILSGNVARIEAVYTQSGTIYAGDSLDVLKPDLVVTAYYLDGTSGVIDAYTLDGTLTAGTSTITVVFGLITTTFTVSVTADVWLVTSDKFAKQVALRAKYTSDERANAATINGVVYYFTDTAGNGPNRACYYLFDLLLTAGKQYKYIVYFDGLETGQTVNMGLQYYDETFRQAGVANAGETSANYLSHLFDDGWKTLSFSNGVAELTHTVPTGGVGVRIPFRVLNSSSQEIVFPDAITITKIIILEVN